jgi:hypothetical protein
LGKEREIEKKSRQRNVRSLDMAAFGLIWIAAVGIDVPEFFFSI